jgi:hypothetical protein
MKRLTKGIALAALASAALPTSTRAQVPTQLPDSAQADERSRPVALTLYGLLYTDFGAVTDPGSSSRWHFADAAMGAGAGVHVGLGPVALGVDASFTRTRYEREPRGSQGSAGAGRATLASLLVGGRLSSAGLPIPGIPGVPGPVGRRGRGGAPEGISTYLAAGGGVLSYGLEDLGGVNADLAFAAGGGLEYTWAAGNAAFLEWKRLWSFHEREGVESATSRHSRIELGARIPLRR